MTVLFVDDEPAVLRVIERVLRDAPFEVMTALGRRYARVYVDQPEAEQ